MPTLDNHQSHFYTKMLLEGDSGSGKTGALCSLVNEGYKLRVLDLDNGLDSLVHHLDDKKTYPKADKSTVIFETLTDELRAVGGKVVPVGVPKAWTKSMDLLTQWKVPGDKGYDLGSPAKWGPESILVIDSLTSLGAGALRHVLAVNGRSAVAPWQSDWGEAMRLLEDCLALLYSETFQTNVIVISHITYGETEGAQIMQGFPSALGSKLPPKVPRYFNTVVRTKTKGSGATAPKVIRTVSEGIVELKNPASRKVPAELPLETGLAELFRYLRN